MGFGLIYKVINNTNLKIYIGQTILSLKRRKNIHENSKKDWYFSRALRKYNKDNFKWEVIEECDSKEEMDEMEFHYIKQYNSFKPNGYNLTLGGDGVVGYKHTFETKKKLSDLNIGKKLSKETLLKLSKAHKGFKHSEESKKKMSETRKGKKLSVVHKNRISNSHKGKKRAPFTDEARRNMSLSKKGKPNFKNSKKYIITFPDGNKLFIENLNYFCSSYKDQKLWPKYLSACAVGKIDNYKGFKCMYYKEEI